jgi:putative flippase GtrA
VFFSVWVGGFLFSFGILAAVVAGAGWSAAPAQATAPPTATPLNFLGNKLWSFRE